MTNENNAYGACQFRSMFVDWSVAAETVAARALAGAGSCGWRKSNSAELQTHGGTGTTPRVAFSTGTCGAAGVRDPFVLAPSAHRQQHWRQQQQQQQQQQQ